MELYKLGTTWGSKAPDFYGFIRDRKIALSYENNCSPKKSSVILIASGFNIKAITILEEDVHPVTDNDEFEETFEKYGIDYSDEVTYAKAKWIELKTEDQFKFDTQIGICQIRKPEIHQITQSLISKYMQKEKMNQILNLLYYKKQIILQGPPGIGKTRLAKEIANELTASNEKAEEATVETTPILTVDQIKLKLKVGQTIPSKTGLKLEIVELGDKTVSIQSKNSNVWRPSYKKIIASFENQFWAAKGRAGGFKPYEDAIAKYFYENEINSLEKVTKETKSDSEYIKLVQFHPSYTYEDIVRGIVSKPDSNSTALLYEAQNKLLADFALDAQSDKENNYVLIIDEINRANLSSVLGELIYALEYRNETVESMYEVDGSNKLLLPLNLYIIGTMNTADRSVGHIDYAIRRRFAFVDVLPEDLGQELGADFKSDIFKSVYNLFYDKKADHLSSEFEPQQVCLGHSYFIQQYEKDANGEQIKDKPIDFQLRLKYEIVPILEEYIRDGVLKENAKEVVNKLKSINVA